MEPFILDRDTIANIHIPITNELTVSLAAGFDCQGGEVGVGDEVAFDVRAIGVIILHLHRFVGWAPPTFLIPLVHHHGGQCPPYPSSHPVVIEDY